MPFLLIGGTGACIAAASVPTTAATTAAAAAITGGTTVGCGASKDLIKAPSLRFTFIACSPTLISLSGLRLFFRFGSSFLTFDFVLVLEVSSCLAGFCVR